MKIERQPTEFHPIIITLEGLEEVSALAHILDHCSFLGRENEHAFNSYCMCLAAKLLRALREI